MLASEILKEMQPKEKYVLMAERVFSTLALCGERLDKSFCTFVDSTEFISDISSNVSMIITTQEIAEVLDENRFGFVITKNPRLFFFSMHNFLRNNFNYARKIKGTIISEHAQISDITYIAEENVIIEDGVIIEPFVTIYPNVIIKKNAIIRSGAKIGGEGFEYKRDEDGLMAVKHLGGVIIEENVEIQNNSCIDKAVYPWDNTMIGRNVKIDNLVHIGHGVKIEKDTMVVANTGIGGRTIIGENSWIGLGATIRNGICIGNKARVNMGAVVTKTVKEGESVSGNFAIEHDKFIGNMKKTIYN